MTRRRRSEIQLFSTSFLDLLSCSLAAVALLWVLVGTPTRERPRPRFAVLTIRQTLNNHFSSLRILNNQLGTEALPNYERLSSGGSNETPKSSYESDVLKEKLKVASLSFVDAKNNPQIFFEWSDREDPQFPGSLTVIVLSSCPAGELRVAFRECHNADNSHPIHILQVLNDRKTDPKQFVFEGKMAETREVVVRFGQGRIVIETDELTKIN